MIGMAASVLRARTAERIMAIGIASAVVGLAIAFIDGGYRPDSGRAEHIRPNAITAYQSPGTGYMNVSVPEQALLPREVQTWRRLLAASDEQMHFIWLMYERFVEQHNAVMDREAPVHLAEAAALAATWRASRTTSTPEYSEIAHLVDRSGARLRRQLEQLEHELVDVIEPILTPAQAERLSVLRARAARRQYRFMPGFVRWADVDLSEFWEEIVELALPAERHAVDAVLAGYESNLTALVRRQTETKLESRSKGRRNWLRVTQGQMSMEEHRQEYASMGARKLDAGRRIRLLNQTTLSAITEHVSDEVGTSLIIAVKTAVFPELYPDPTDPLAIVAALLGHPELDLELKEVVSVLSGVFSEQYARTCDRLEAACIEWGDRTEAGDPMGGQPLDLLTPLLEEREALSRQWLRELEKTVGPAVLEVARP
jgi:hypothetical protein